MARSNAAIAMTIRLLLLTLVPLVLSLQCPQPQCDCVTGDELEYFCRAGTAHVSLLTRNNEYVNLKCIGTNFTCSDLPTINLSNNLTLPSLGVTNCAPTVLRCINGMLQAASVSSMVITNATEGLSVEALRDSNELHSIMIKSSPEKTIPVNALNSLKNLRHLRITTSNIDLISNAFIGSPPIEFLELSSDHITSLPENAFNGLSKLTILNIWGNNFSHVEENSFRGLESLQKITLNTNHISSIAERAFTHTPKLKSVLLMANVLKELPTGLLSHLQDLENVTIQYNLAELQLHPRSLSNLTSLKNLFLQTCQIKRLPEDLLSGSFNIQSLLLNNNGISALPDKIFHDQKFLEHLDLSFNKLHELKASTFSSLRQLKTLNLNRNYLKLLPDFLFSGLRQLTSVSLENNLLSSIDPSAFQGATALETLNLAVNNLTLTSNDQFVYTNFEKQSPFSDLRSLKTLDLRGNNIDTIFDDWRNSLLNLKILDLSWNIFTELDMYDVQFLARDITVDLRHNNISRLWLTYVSPSNSKSPSESKLPNSSILLEGNTFICDCVLYPLALRLKGARPDTAEPKFVLGHAWCSSPVQLQGRILSELSPSDFNCDLATENCSDACTKCVKRPAFNDIDLDCVNVPPIFPDIEGFEYYSLKLQKAPSYVGNLSLNLLNVSNINLEEIPFEPTDTIKVIDFSNNNLKRIPIDFLEANSTLLYLAGNEFECNCWYSNEISVLQKSVLVQDLDLINCHNGDKLVQVDVVALCSSWRAAAVASGTFISMVLIVFFVALTVYRYSQEILIYIIEHGLFPCCFTEDMTDSDKEFDVFISFAHKDRTYLRELLPKIENDFRQKTCLHYRDWYAGDLIPSQIERSVESSRKTLILLSKNYLESQYANMEFQAAHNLALKQGKTRVILILLEDVSQSEKISDELKAYMKTNTYLTWDDPRFWERLQKALPRRMTKKFVFPDIFKHGEIKTISGGLDVHLNSDGKLVNVAVKDVKSPLDC